MIVISAGAEVRAREPHVGEAGAVGAAADRNDLRLDAAGCHRLFGGIDQVHARLNFFFHAENKCDSSNVSKKYTASLL